MSGIPVATGENMPESAKSNKSDETQLLCCPFCGQKPEYYHFTRAEFSEKVMCSNKNCHIQPMGYFESMADMIEAWNHRAV